MPTVTVNASAGEVGYHADIPAGGEPTIVRFGTASRWGTAELINRGAGALWYTLDGSTPTVGGRNCFYLPPQAVDSRTVFGGGAVSILGDTATAVSVQRGS